MTADIGSKYQTFANTDSQNKILTHDIVGPNSKHFRGMDWMTNIEKEYDEQNIVTARNMKITMAVKHDEAVAFKSGLKSSKVTQLTDKDKIIIDGKVYNVQIPAASNDNLEVEQPPVNFLNGGKLSTNQPVSISTCQPINTLNGGKLPNYQPVDLSTYQPINTLNGGKSSVVSRQSSVVSQTVKTRQSC